MTGIRTGPVPEGQGPPGAPPRSPWRRRDPRAGLTLVELLIALAIFAVILVLLLSSFTGAERTRALLSDRSRGFRQIRLCLDRIGTELSNALAADWIPATAFTCSADTFSGRPASTLSFTAFALPGDGGPRPQGDIVKVRYSARVGSDGTSIELYREVSDLPLIENRIAPRETRIADRLLGFKVEMDKGNGWTTEWPAEGGKKSALPRRVAFVLTDALGREFRRVVTLPLAGRESAILLSGKRNPEQK